jgi:uncharacterized protein (DUF488 family)
MRELYTIGHSNHAIDKFVALLAAHGIETVADVRSQPYSRFNPQFKRDALRASLAAAGIGYEFLGAELGARASDPACYVDGKVDYALLAASEPFRRGIERVAALAGAGKIALLCAERDPLTCHRTILVCPELVARGFEPRHILADGGLETHAAALERLVAELGIGGPDLFDDTERLVAEAQRRRGRQIAYAPKS